MMTRRLTRNALLTAVALIIFVVELAIPNPFPVPGVKLGLANIVTVYAMFKIGPADTLMILLSRILLGSMFSGQMMSFFYSLTGGIFCYLVMLVLVRILSTHQIWVCSVIGAICHNFGQILVAIVLTKTTALIVYLPVLVISGILTGLFTGFAAQFLCEKMEKLRMNTP